MDISKFLLIDAVFVIAAMPLIFWLKNGINKSKFSGNSRNEELFKKTSVKLPKREKIEKLEKFAQNQGSGIEFASLIGDWKFVSVWKKDQYEEDLVFTSLLRVFSANIEFKKNHSTENPKKFPVIASIQFGLFTFKFSGSGCLKGKQPLLKFFLNLIELKTGSTILFSRSLDKQEDKEKSFFALIALEENGTWLSARGQGGAIIIWLKD